MDECATEKVCLVIIKHFHCCLAFKMKSYVIPFASLLVLTGHWNINCTILPTIVPSALSCVCLSFSLSVFLCLFFCLVFCCRTQAEMAHTCRGTINLATAHIDTEDACNIVLSSGGRTYHLKASTEVERQRWVTALELAKAKAIRMMNDQSGKRSWRRQLLVLTI